MKTVCRYFRGCTNEAVTTVPNPILGPVPCCQRCADKYAFFSSAKSAPRPQEKS